jgi:outer membrane protein assembly factor BamB
MNAHRRLRRVPFTIVGLLLATALTSAADVNWPRWRGPQGTGHTAEANLPLKWDANAIVWKTPLKGSGQSSPIIWGDRIFLTSALDSGAERLVFCVDRKNGKMLWEKSVWKGTPEKSHTMNGWATACCAVDADRVVAFFGKGGLHCLDHDGKVIWSRNLGEFPGIWGTAASPVIFEDLVIQNCDAAGEGLLLAVDKTTGKDKWRTKRAAPDRGGWTTPVLVKTGNTQELVVNGERAVTGYDPKTGKELWTCKSFSGRGDPTVLPGDGVVYVVNGQPGDFYAVKTGGRSDVTKTHMAWHTPRKTGRDQPSPILVGKFLIVSSMEGIATCYDATNGKVLWSERLKGKFSSSPIEAGGKVYFQNEAGDTSVLELGGEYNLLTTNTLSGSGEVFRASLTPCAGQIFSRSDKTLYCIGAGKTN